MSVMKFPPAQAKDEGPCVGSAPGGPDVGREGRGTPSESSSEGDGSFVGERAPSAEISRALRRSVSTVRLLEASFLCAAVGLFLAVVQLASMFRGAGGPDPRSTTQERRAYVRFAAPGCMDTPGWANGWAGCAVEPGGHDPEACKPNGWSCKAYGEKGWCRNATAVADFLGPTYYSPENNCCVCGGGAQVQTLAAALCKDNHDCPNTTDVCCPTESGAWLECCAARPPTATSTLPSSSAAARASTDTGTYGTTTLLA